MLRVCVLEAVSDGQEQPLIYGEYEGAYPLMLQQAIREHSMRMWILTSGSAARQVRMLKGIRRVLATGLDCLHSIADGTARNSYRVAASVGLPVRTGKGCDGHKGRILSISFSGAVYAGRHGRRSA
jgi:hypothetical protein